MTEKQLRAAYASPDDETVTTAATIKDTRSACAEEYSIVRARAHGGRVRVLVWRHRCLCHEDSTAAFVDAKTGRLHISRRPIRYSWPIFVMNVRTGHPHRRPKLRYTYDAMGNMLDRALGGSVVPSSPSDSDSGSVTPARVTHLDYAGPRVSAVTENGLVRSVTYDEHGNETSYIATRTYLPRHNLLWKIEDGGEGVDHHVVTYQYDGRGVRVVRTETPVADPNGWAAQRTFVYSPELQLLSVTADDRPNLWGKRAVTNDVFIPRYDLVYFGGQPVAQIDGATGAVRYTFTDHLGTPLLQTSANAAVIWQAEYEPFGNVWQMRTGGFAEQPLRFPGQDVATTWEGSEENYNIHRWYRSGWGRYTQADPIGIALETNEYAYASDYPTGAVDPLGESTINVTKSSEQTYDTLAAYQSANPCHVNGVSFSCTERIYQRLSCVCRCIAKDTYAMDVTVDVQLKYHLAGGPPRAPRPRAFFWSAYRQHENLHLNDLITKVTAHADSLESNRYTTMDDCNRGCGAAIGGFSDWMNQWAIDSNRRLH